MTIFVPVIIQKKGRSSHTISLKLHVLNLPQLVIVVSVSRVLYLFIKIIILFISEVFFIIIHYRI